MRMLNPDSGLRASLAQFRLQLLGMVKMRDERRSHFNQQSFELGILRTRDERFVHGIQHRLVIRNFVIDIRLVKGMALQLLQRGQIAIAALLQALAGRIGVGI